MNGKLFLLCRAQFLLVLDIAVVNVGLRQRPGGTESCSPRSLTWAARCGEAVNRKEKTMPPILPARAQKRGDTNIGALHDETTG